MNERGQSSSTQYAELIDFLEHVGKDPSRLIFEDELTGLHNRRFLRSYVNHKVRWEGDRDYPLSLLIIDLDQFKRINDTHGHETGDQALTWIAAVLKDVGGQVGLPIRFGGDEFMLLLPKASLDDAREIADRLLERTLDRPFRLRDSGVAVPITLSIGIASAPEDATTGQGLIQAADTALYHAKQSGRNRAASAAEIDPAKVFPKTALHRLVATGIAGREEQLTVISEALQRLSRGHGQFLIFEAGPGIGKTTFLDTVGRNLAEDASICVTKVAGDQQEAYRPYYLATRIVVAVLNHREDKGAAVFEDLTKEEVAYLAHILPQLGEGEASRSDTDDSVKRQGIFASLAKFLPRAVDYRPLVLIIDDLQFADEATLLLLRVLMQRQDLTLLVCGSSLESLKLSGEEEAPPLERFYSAHDKELGMRRVKLPPLSRDDIVEYLRGVFPSLKMPDGFDAELAQITHGNPLFLAEIIRKLVIDRKVSLAGQQWVIEPLEEGYLPRSLEEIVTQKIAALDEESRQLLERASTLGEDIPVSVLTGSSELDENRVLEFLDRAEALGLVSLDFQINDEIMRFLGKRVLEISYGAIEQDRRQELHEQVGSYQEGLYQQRLLPSASLLAYHFKRSANQEKAQQYERIQLAFTQTVFSPEEAANYAAELLEDEGETEPRLDPESIPRVPNILRAVMSAVRNIQLYPPESAAIVGSLHQVKGAVEEILEKNQRLHLSHAQRFLLANGRRLDISGFKFLAGSFLDLLSRTELQGLVFYQGITEDEIKTLLMALGNLKPEAIDRGFWSNFSRESGLQHIELHQMRYSRLRKKKSTAGHEMRIGDETKLGPDELAEIPRILRALQGAANNVKLYPLDSEPVSRSIERLHESLQGVLGERPALTLAGVDHSLLVNGGRVDTAGFDNSAANLLKLIDSIGLRSITFFSNVPLTELKTFVSALGEPPTPDIDKGFWDDFTREKGLTHIAFNQRQYALGVVHSLLSSVESGIDEEETEEDATAELSELIPEEPSEAVREALPRFGRELLIRGEHGLVRRLVRQLFEDARDEDPLRRELAVQACRSLFDSLILGLRHKFTELAADPLLAALAEETDPRVMQELAIVLYSMSSDAVQFDDYQLASRILLEAKTRRQELEYSGIRNAETLARQLERKLDSTAQKLLEDDLTSGEPDRQERAAQVMGCLGRPGIPLLAEVIKQEKDFRVRQMAASLLAEMGPHAGEQLKRALVTEVTVEQRFRILEVIDTVNRDLRDELAFCLGDGNRKIRRAAFRLFERLHEDDLIDLIIPYARGKDPAVAKGAIRSLAHLRSPAAVDALVQILSEAREAEKAIACCLALGRLGDAMGIEALAQVLSQRKFRFFGRRWSEQVRATAAMALRQISDPRAAQVLSRYTEDRATRVRQLARSFASEETL